MLDGVASVLTSPHVFVGVLHRRDDVENRLDVMRVGPNFHGFGRRDR